MPISGRRAAAAVTVLSAVLLAPAPASADPAHDPTVSCVYWQQGTVDGDGVLTYTGVAYTPADHEPLVTLTVTCRFTSTEWQYTATSTAGTPVVTMSGSAMQSLGPVTVTCAAVARYADGHSATVEVCT